MSQFPPSFKPVEHSIPHSCAPDDLPPSSLFALASSPPSSGSDKPVLVLLHGYPQTHTLWQPVSAWLDANTDIFARYRVLVPDLPGYGKSRKAVSPDGSHEANSKREMGKDILALVDAVWPADRPKVVLVAHDRGARVAYRLAKDSPDRVVGLNVQDIVPTAEQFKRFTYDHHRHLATFGYYHWIFLATPAPMAEMLLLSTPDIAPQYARYSISSWTGPAFRSSTHKLSTPYGDVASPNYAVDLMDSWCHQYRDPDVVRGSLEDYRAGATIDLDHDEADGEPDGEGLRVKCPLLALWCAGLERAAAPGEDVKRTWEARGPREEGRTRAKRVDTEGVGHFLPVEAPEEVGKEVSEWIERFF
ncbi:hypothetical protein JCM3775_005169 [Rhodotorula graminis]|uniref:AB hydrolase-1 domain-containing protein n=1 Tax=Rhodotorula graminis (strain WP1) TaxID=578459 RepID=A0A0P9GH49_RHOGW|nr:uncharacterized protein RHOBADRAFT_56055 [Rhodotorula graminis WP1]KPV72242.1 hypothetical protein RHOBADRAFT_56055 [Rhodotorula graminis WP1]